MKLVLIFCLCVSSILATPFAKENISGRIVGGQVAKDNQFPYQVAVYYDNAQGSFFGGGALIDPKWVLTAGHVTFGAKEFTLHLGSNSLVLDDPKRVTLGAAYSVTHPDFDINTLQNDIGLIRIDTPYQINDHIKVIPMGNFAIAGNIPVIVSGWGANGDWDGATPDLYFVALKTITNADCQLVYGSQITDGILCAKGPTNEGTCNGDSGSPLISQDPSGNPIHIGVVSFASASGCKTDHPSGYTRTAPYIQWILQQIGA